MIDWISANVPLSWDVPITGGAVVHYRPDGSVQWGTDKTLHLKGSHDARISLRSVERGRIEISGNPVKFLQGHNLFGSDDLHGLLLDALDVVTDAVGVKPSPEDRAAWHRGDIRLRRVDVTGMFQLPSFGDVTAWLQAAGSVASIKRRGRGQFDEGTLYFGRVGKGREASPWQMKLYHKGAEVLAPGHRLSDRLEGRERLIEWASDKLRIEVTLRSKELKRLGLSNVDKWTREIAGRTYEAFLAKLEIGEQQMVDVCVEEQLKPSHRAAFIAWKSGADMRAVLSRATFFRYRSEIKAITGADIGTLCAASNVIPLRRTIEAVPVGVPEWAGALLHRPRPRLAVVA